MRMSRRMGVYSQGKKIRYYGTVSAVNSFYPTNISTFACAAPVGDYAVFGSGRDSFISGCAYDKSLVSTNATSLVRNTEYASSAHNGSYAIFAGGSAADTDDRNSNASCIDASLVSSHISGIMYTSSGRGPHANVNYSCRFGDYAVFGYYAGSSNSYHGITVISQALVETLVPTPSGDRSSKACAACTTYAICAGGGYGNVAGDGISAAGAIDGSLVATSVAALSVGRGCMAAGTVNDHMLFIGGSGSSVYWVAKENSTSRMDAVDCYDNALVHTTLSPLPTPTALASCVPMEKGLLVAGGFIDKTVKTNAAYIYTPDLVRTDAPPLSSATAGYGACAVGKYAIFGKLTPNLSDVYVC